MPEGKGCYPTALPVEDKNFRRVLENNDGRSPAAGERDNGLLGINMRVDHGCGVANSSTKIMRFARQQV